jgi:hypothetical protein
MNCPTPRRWVLVVVAAAWLLFPVLARANMAAPPEDEFAPGDSLSEPSGGIKQVAVEREDLALDLRPLETGPPTSYYRRRLPVPAERESEAREIVARLGF